MAKNVFTANTGTPVWNNWNRNVVERFLDTLLRKVQQLALAEKKNFDAIKEHTNILKKCERDYKARFGVPAPTTHEKFI